MKTSGWIFMILSWGIILVLVVYCFYKVLINNKKVNEEDK